MFACIVNILVSHIAQSCCEKTESVNNVEAVEKEQIASELTACEFEEKSL